MITRIKTPKHVFKAGKTVVAANKRKSEVMKGVRTVIKRVDDRKKRSK